jgi:hypothetical protein
MQWFARAPSTYQGPLQVVSWVGTVDLDDLDDDEDADEIAFRTANPYRIISDFGFDAIIRTRMRTSSYGQIPSARMGFCTWITRVESQAMRDAYTIWLWDRHLLRHWAGQTQDPLLPPCTWCGSTTGLFCDLCADQGVSPARPVCSSCDQLLDCCRTHYSSIHDRDLGDPVDGKDLIIRALRRHRDDQSALFLALQNRTYQLGQPNTWWHDRFLNQVFQPEEREILFPYDPDFF